MTPCSQVAPLLAAHAFEALEPDELREVEEHLELCQSCREALARLAVLPALLDFAGTTDGPIQIPPPLLEASVLAAIPRGRRPFAQPRRGPALRRPVSRRVIAAVIAVLVVAGAGLSQVLSRPPYGGVRVELSASTVEPGARAIVYLRPHPWGTEVNLNAQGLTPTRGAQIYEVWFVSPRGRVSAGTFTVPSQGHVTVRLAAAVHANQYRSLGITREPDGLNPARRGPNVLRARLPA